MTKPGAERSTVSRSISVRRGTVGDPRGASGMSASLDAMRTQLSASLSSTSPGLSSADALCATCVALFGIDGAAVSLIVDGSSSGTFGASSASSRRLDEYQFTYGEGPCLDAVSAGRSR